MQQRGFSARMSDEGGAALAWAMMLLAAVATAIALSGGALARELRVARLATEAAALEDLRESAFAVGRVRAGNPTWRGPALVEMECGSASVILIPGAHPRLHVEARARLTGRVVITDRASGTPGIDPS
jgi:hypothetical protein